MGIGQEEGNLKEVKFVVNKKRRGFNIAKTLSNVEQRRNKFMARLADNDFFCFIVWASAFYFVFCFFFHDFWFLNFLICCYMSTHVNKLNIKTDIQIQFIFGIDLFKNGYLLLFC